MTNIAGMNIENINIYGSSIEKVIMAGNIVWSGSGSWDWVETFSEESLPNGWSIIFGTHTPPGLGALYAMGPQVDNSFEIMFKTNSSGGAILIADGQYNQILSLSREQNGNIVLSFGSTAVVNSTYPDTAEIRLRRQDGFYKVFIDGEMAVGDAGGLMLCPDTVTTDLFIVGAGINGIVTSISYRALQSEYTGPFTVVREGIWGPLADLETPGYVFRSYNALGDYNNYAYHDIKIEAWGDADITAAVDINESSGQYDPMHRILSDYTTTGNADRSILIVEDVILGGGDTIWMGALSEIGAPLRGKYLVVRKDEV